MDKTYEELAKLGTHFKSLLSQFINDRAYLEIQWLKNLRQVVGNYDPETLALIPTDKSHVYPRDTRIKVKGGVAKLMEMMFPAKENNWSLDISPNPSIPQDALQTIIQVLSATGEQVTSDQIEREVKAFATVRKDNMEREIADQLADPGVDYPNMCKRVVRSGYIYGVGVVRSPMVRTQQERVWELDTTTGTYAAKTKTIRRPYPEFVRVWDLYLDLSAKNWVDQEMMFERFVLSRSDFRNLGKRSDFKAGLINQYLRDHTTGNYTEKSYESDLRTLDKTSNLADRTARRYEVYRALGFVSAQTLRNVGVEVKDSELDSELFVDAWFIDNVVIKVQRAAFGERPSDQYHAFIYSEDEDAGLTGVGLPEEVRDSQMSLCATTRALMDNVAAVAGPIFEVNVDLLPKGRKAIGAIHSFMTIDREGSGPEAAVPAVRQLNTSSHVPEILQVINMQRQQLDVESNLPAYTMGAMQNQPLGEAFRTTSNMSMMVGSANMVTKDTVRAFDKFTTAVITSLLNWNMEFNTKESIKGDYQVVAKGNLSLVAKEIRGAALDQFVTTLTPEERAILDTYGILIDRLKSRDLPTDRVLPKEEAMKVLENMRAAQSQAANIEQGAVQAKTDNDAAKAEKTRAEAQMIAASADATINEIVSRIEANLAKAKSAGDKTQLENLRTLLEAAKPETGAK